MAKAKLLIIWRNPSPPVLPKEAEYVMHTQNGWSCGAHDDHGSFRCALGCLLGFIRAKEAEEHGAA